MQLGHTGKPGCSERVLNALRAGGLRCWHGVVPVLFRCTSGISPVNLRYISGVSLVYLWCICSVSPLHPHREIGSPAMPPPSHSLILTALSWRLFKGNQPLLVTLSTLGIGTPDPLPEIGAAWYWVEPLSRRASPFRSPRPSLAITHISRPRELNPKGIPSQSPGLRAASYPGWDAKLSLNPNGVVALIPQQTDSTPLGLAVSGRFSQGSSRLATLGWRTQSLWD